MIRVVYGKPTLSRVPCETCREDTIHRNARCIHCGGYIRHAVVTQPTWRDDGAMAIKRDRAA